MYHKITLQQLVVANSAHIVTRLLLRQPTLYFPHRHEVAYSPF